MFLCHAVVAILCVRLVFSMNERASKVARVLRDHVCVTCRFGLHVSGKLAADTVVVGANVVKTPASELLGTVELPTYKIIIYIISCFGCRNALFELNLNETWSFMHE